MLPIEPNWEVSFIGAVNFVAICGVFAVVAYSHRTKMSALERNHAEIMLAKAHADQGATASVRTNDTLAGLPGEIVARMAADAAGVAATLAGHTPTATPLPAELRLVISAETEKPHIVTS